MLHFTSLNSKMETETIQKNEASSKSHTSRGNNKMKLLTLQTTLLFLVVLIISLTGCKTTHVLGGGPLHTQKTISVNSEPTGARVLVNGRVSCVSTPCEITIPLTYKKHKSGFMTPEARARRSAEMNQTKFTFILDGYVHGEEIYQPNVQWKGGAGDNQIFDYPDAVFHFFAVPTPVQQQVTQQQVSRVAPGTTEMERTVIRWRFDSDPRGARISWRVISNIPDVVRNTNETYLSTTPYEETRSFDILGLTYENSNNVSIEVKVERRGYHEQVRRYNVRQALDQREISGFFELVPMN